MLGSIIRCVLDILWSDRESQSLRELNSIMHASQLLFVFKEEHLTTKSPLTVSSQPSSSSNSSAALASSHQSNTRTIKVYLSGYICEHQIWQEVKVWRLSLQRLINLKFHDAVKALEKSKEEQKRAAQEKA